MIFLCTHQIIQNLIPWKEGTKDSKKNITTFVVGGLLYVFLLSFLFSPGYRSLIENNFVLFTLKNWLLLVVIIDVTAMAVIYKCYYNRSIVNELPEILATDTVEVKEKTNDLVKDVAKDDLFVKDVAKDQEKDVEKDIKSFEDEVKEAHKAEDEKPPPRRKENSAGDKDKKNANAFKSR